MKKALPKAAYIAFTGTPLLKDEKTANKFGPIVHATPCSARWKMKPWPRCCTRRKRVPELDINEEAVNRWFEKITSNLSDAQRTDLKKVRQEGRHLRRSQPYRADCLGTSRPTSNENIKEAGARPERAGGHRQQARRHSLQRRRWTIPVW